MVKFFVADQVRSSSEFEVSESYFRENLDAERGGVRIVRDDGVTELIAGSRYLPPDTGIRTKMLDGKLQVVYRDTVLREFTHWLDASEIQPRDYPLGADR
ncbi:hypothetical protein ACWDTP_12125 [Mycobacterium sp. NPDC003449]